MTAIHRLVLVGVWALAGVAAVAADPVPKPAALPAPLPTKDGVQLVLADGSGTTREAALKAAYAAAVGQVAKTFVAKERLTGGDDKVLAEAILTAANGVVAEAKELSAAKEDGVWRVRVVARVAPLKLFDQLRAAKVPVTAAAAVDGASEFAKAASRLEAEKNAAAWFAFLLRDYPFGCYKVEVVSQDEDKALSNDKEVVWNVRVRYTIDEAKYQAVANALADSCEHLSLRPSLACSVDTRPSYSDRDTYPYLRRADFPNTAEWKSLRKWCDAPENRATLVRVVTNVKTIPAMKVKPGEGWSDNREEHRLTGRAFPLPKDVSAAFGEVRDRKATTRILLKDTDGKVVAGWGYYWNRSASNPVPIPFIETNNNTTFIQPSVVSAKSGLSMYSMYAAKLESTHPIRVPLADLRRVTKTEVEIVVGK